MIRCFALLLALSPCGSIVSGETPIPPAVSAAVDGVSPPSKGADSKAPEKNARPAPPPIYTLSELLNKAERIVVADVGPATGDGGVLTLLVHETLKAPEDPKYIDPERLKRAAELLADDKRELPPLPPPAPARKAPATIAVTTAGLKLPPEGTQLLFFLWERAPREALPSPADPGKAAPAGEAPYRIHHPQCVYEVELLARVKAALARPRSVADGRYLREWDRRMAERARQREADEALLKAPGGELKMGMRLRAARAAPALRGDNSFSVAAIIENSRERPQSIYDGPAGGFGLRLRSKDSEPGSGTIVHVSNKDAIADPAVLNLADITDFSVVAGNGSRSKELYFDARDYEALRGLSGDYLISLFFSTEHDGKGLDLDTQPVFTGTLISEEIPLRFGPEPKK